MIAVSGWIDGTWSAIRGRVDADFTGRLLDIVHEGFDLAIRVGPLSDSSLAARRLGTLGYGLYAAPAYAERRGEPEHPAGLSTHELVVFSGGSP